MRVLLVSTPVAPLGHPLAGGVSAIITAMARALAARGHGVEVVCPAGSAAVPGARLLPCDGVWQPPAQRRPEAPATGPAGVLPAMLAAAAGRPADAVAHLAYDLPAVEAAAADARPAGVHLTMPSLGDGRLDAAVRRLAARRPGAVSTMSAAQARSFGLPAPGEGPGAAAVLGMGLDPAANPLVLRPGPRLAWAGRIAAEKRPADALAVAARCRLPLDVCGAVEDPTVWRGALAAHPGVEVVHHGHLPPAGLAAVLGRATAFLQTSGSFEAFGIAACEAMACGTPVAAYRGGSAAEIVEPDCGVLVEEGDVAALAAAVPVAARLDRRGVRASIERRFSLAAYGERLERWLLRLPGPPAASAGRRPHHPGTAAPGPTAPW